MTSSCEMSSSSVLGGCSVAVLSTRSLKTPVSHASPVTAASVVSLGAAATAAPGKPPVAVHSGV
eukprot:1024833-Rhodomonas_salina.1